MFTFLMFHKTSKRASTLSNFYNVLSFVPLFSLFPSLLCPFFLSISRSVERAARRVTVIALTLDDIFVDYIYSRRNPHRCSVATYRRMTSTSSLVLATRRPLSTRSCTEALSTDSVPWKRSARTRELSRNVWWCYCSFHYRCYTLVDRKVRSKPRQ